MNRIYHYCATRYKAGREAEKQDGLIRSDAPVGLGLTAPIREAIAKNMGTTTGTIIITSLTLIGEEEAPQ